MTVKNKHTMFMGVYVAILLLISMIASNCSGSGSPVKKKYPPLTLPVPEYALSADTFPFRFDVSDQAKLSVRKTKEGEYFCDLLYPSLNAQLYCTWHKITPDKFSQITEESRKLAYQHTAMATGIKEKIYTNDLARVYGVLYDIQGDVATPLQIALTDSNTYFFNASLYFNATPNADSIAPVLEYIRRDVIRLMETFQNNDN